MSSRYYDISVPVKNGGLIYPGNPPISITPHKSVAEGATSNLSLISFGSHTGTHVDAERHFFDDGAGVDDIPLELLNGPARLIEVPDSVRAIGSEHLKQERLEGCRRLLIRTRNSSIVTGDTFDEEFTYLDPDGAEFIAGLGIELVGVDYLSIEQFHSGHHRTHRTLLSKGIVIVEGLDLSEPPVGEYMLHCLPLRLAGLDGAPARAILISTDGA